MGLDGPRKGLSRRSENPKDGDVGETGFTGGSGGPVEDEGIGAWRERGISTTSRAPDLFWCWELLELESSSSESLSSSVKLSALCWVPLARFEAALVGLEGAFDLFAVAVIGDCEAAVVASID